MKRAFKTRHFVRWMRKTGLTDEIPCRAVSEMQQGLIDADLGSGLHVILNEVKNLKGGMLR
ncbi:MAG: type II toxin-antitoxin system RelE/ParE family toxin [Nitrospinae bacterium]|nr:type II toxin-antitoxin system RelE/ParE family toxin [Nitrospinota bacterium]